MNRNLVQTTFLALALLTTAAIATTPKAQMGETPQPQATLLSASPIPGCGGTSKLSTTTVATPHKLAVQGFVPIGGQEQWVTLNGEDCKKPAILFLHGGPGNPLSPFGQNLYGSWAKDFTLVQWDQRGAGQTFGRNPGTAESTLTLDQMVNDGIAVAEWVGQRLGQKKLILMGSSWGSVLGVHMAKRRPDLFHAYVGTAQMVSYQANEAASYAQTLALATAADDKKTVAALQAIGLPPRTDPRAFGVLRRAIRAYEGKVATPAPRAWWQPESRYSSAQALETYEQGEDYSFLQFVGPNGDGIFSKVDLPRLGVRFDIPVYLVQGQEDLLTPLSVTQIYFDSLQAPDKILVVVPKVGHDPNEALLAAQHQVLMERVVPMTRMANSRFQNQTK